MADQYPWHVCVHHVESYGMILLGDLVFDIYEQVPVACHVSTIVGLELVVGVVQQAFPWQSIPTQVRKQSLEFMQWNAARLRPRINFNLHHHGTSFTWHPDGHVCDDLRPIVWICVSIQPLRGLILSIGALSHLTMNCKARKPVVRTFLFRS